MTKSAARTHDSAVLHQILDAARAADGRGVVVFDLDSTLLDNRPRQSAILREFGVARGIRALDHMRPDHWRSWSMADAMARAGVDDKTIEASFEDARAFWRERFFTSDYCALDGAIAGAADYVRAIVRAGATVAYCTGRHEAMRAGTVHSLAALCFPLPGERVHLLMKPSLDEHDDVYKETAYAKLATLGAVIAAFDNEPTHINGYRSHFAAARCVHLDTDHSGRDVVLLDGILSIRDFTAHWT